MPEVMILITTAIVIPKLPMCFDGLATCECNASLAFEVAALLHALPSSLIRMAVACSTSCS